MKIEVQQFGCYKERLIFESRGRQRGIRMRQDDQYPLTRSRRHEHAKNKGFLKLFERREKIIMQNAESFMMNS